MNTLLSKKRWIAIIAACLILVGCGESPTASTASTPGVVPSTAPAASTTTTVVTPVVYTLSSPSFSVNPLAANAQTEVSVDVYADGAIASKPTEVAFTSGCADLGKAEITPTGITSDGVVKVTYSDLGCAGTDTISASVTDVYSYTSTGELVVFAADAGSIRFVSAEPTNISLKGTGGQGLQESSRVTFKVVDVAGNAVSGKTVDFALSTTVGGLGLVNASATSDTLGQVVADVTSGTVSTPVRVTASTLGVGGVTLGTQSDILTISTGIPDHSSTSLTATQLNIEGWDYDGATTTLNARFADHFNNPVPDGTAVSFTTEGGQIIGNCVTEVGVCSVDLTSQNIRPTDGRLTVLAYAVGEESFVDKDGDGYVNSVADRADENGVSTDIPEAYMDFNEDGQFNNGVER